MKSYKQAKHDRERLDMYHPIVESTVAMVLLSSAGNGYHGHSVSLLELEKHCASLGSTIEASSEEVDGLGAALPARE